MFLPRPARSGVLALCIALLAVSLAGCHARRVTPNNKETPASLYKKAHKAMEAYDFNVAIKTYERLTASFPFTDEARQSRLDLIYVYYRSGEGESATDAADTFIRENPTHPRVDYAWYVKGLVDFERQPNAIESLFRADLSKRPPSQARKAYAAFKTVVEQYPKSEYAADSLQRMVFLRDRLAAYEVHVAAFYYKRNAFVAAAQRARSEIEQYDGAPSTRQALEILIASYDRLNLPKLADQSREVYAANYSSEVGTREAEVKKSWWKVW
jgi:outer membrane protein assembly factor BamD